MFRFAAASAALLASTAIAQAGGLDRSGLGISPIFEDGTYVELSFGSVMPSVSGTVMGQSSGNMAQDYLNYSFAVRDDLTDRLSYAVMYEQAFGGRRGLPQRIRQLPPLFSASRATPSPRNCRARALTAMLRYELSDRFSIYGGLRYVTMSGEILFDDVPQTLTFESSSDVGYLIGAAFEIPDIALRASITYNSETEHNNPVSNSLPIRDGPWPLRDRDGRLCPAAVGEYRLPDRHRRGARCCWPRCAGRNGPRPRSTRKSALGTIDYDNDVFTYSLGVARRLSDDFAVLGRVTYEDAKGGLASNLAPTGRVARFVACRHLRCRQRAHHGRRETTPGWAMPRPRPSVRISPATAPGVWASGSVSRSDPGTFGKKETPRATRAGVLRCHLRAPGTPVPAARSS